MINIISFVLLASLTFAGTAEEEAIILNQELQFLEESASDIQMNSPLAKTESEEQTHEELSLERTYFNTSERDEIRTKSAAPRRARSF